MDSSPPGSTANSRVGDDQRLQRLGAHHPLAQQGGRELLGGVAQLRPLQLDRPGHGLDRDAAVAIALTLTFALRAGVPVAAQPRSHLVLEDLLKNQPGRQPHHLLEDLGDVPARAEPLMNLGADSLCGRYS